MAEIVSIERKIFGKNSFTNVVDVKFNQLIPQEPSVTQAPDTTVDKFFIDYDSLFFDIPPSGSEKSHQELVIRSSEYLGISFEDLQQEIIQLREENVSLRTQLLTLSNTTSR